MVVVISFVVAIPMLKSYIYKNEGEGGGGGNGGGGAD